MIFSILFSFLTISNIQFPFFFYHSWALSSIELFIITPRLLFWVTAVSSEPIILHVKFGLFFLMYAILHPSVLNFICHLITKSFSLLQSFCDSSLLTQQLNVDFPLPWHTHACSYILRIKPPQTLIKLRLIMELYVTGFPLEFKYLHACKPLNHWKIIQTVLFVGKRRKRERGSRWDRANVIIRNKTLFCIEL